MKFKLSTVLFAFCLIAIVFTWFGMLWRCLGDAENENQISESVQLGLVLGCSIESNAIFEKLGDEKLIETDFSTHRTMTLVENVLDMAFCDFDIRNQVSAWTLYSGKNNMPGRDTLIRIARKSLELLSVHSLEEFENLLLKINVYKYGGKDIIVEGEIDSEIGIFVSRCFAE